MIIEKTKNSIRNSISGIFNKIIVILLPFVIRTIIIRKIGVEYAGIGNLFSSILDILSLTELGFGSAMVFSMYKPIAEDDSQTLGALLKFYKKIYLTIGTVVLIIGIILLPFIPNFINGEYPKDMNLYVLYLIYLLNSASSYFALGYRSSLLTAHQRNDIKSNVNSILSIFQYLIQIIILSLFKNYYLYALMIPVFTIFGNIVLAIITSKKYPKIKCKGELSVSQKENITSKVKALFGHRLGAVILNSVDNIVISSFLGLYVLAQYNNYYYIMNAVFSIVCILYQSLAAGIGNNMINETKESNYDLMKKLLFFFSWVTGFCFICLVCLYQPFMQIWMGSELVLPFIYVILMASYFYIRSIRYVVLTFKDSIGMWNEDKIKPYVEAIVNLILNITFVVIFKGLWGIILSSILAMLVISMPWETYVLLKKHFNESVKNYYAQIAKYLMVTILICFTTFMVCCSVEFLGLSDILTFILKMILTILFSNCMYWIIYHKRCEYKFFKNRLSSVMRKIFKINIDKGGV